MLVALALVGFTPSLVPAQSLGDGYWHTSGNRIVDSHNQQVRFSGVNWNGFESGNFAPHGLWGGARNWKSMLQQMDALGFNLIRLPFAGETLTPGRMPQNIDYGLNPDLAGKTSLEIMDMIVAECGSLGIRIILDYHRVQAGGTPEDGLWFIPGTSHTEQLWIDNWKALVARYAGNPTVVGCDLFNEVHAGGHPGPFWSADGADEPYNWRTAARRCGDAILSVNPNLLICVQGMHEYGGQTGWWGAVHLGVKDHPLTLSVANRLVYSIHDYGPNVWVQPWHNDPAFPNNLFTHWDAQWGFLHNDGIAPVWIGEWGSKLDVTKEVQWATKLRDYIQQKGLSWTWWCWNPNSGDTGGILQDDWTSTHPAKLDLVAPVQYAGFSGGSGGSPPPSGGTGGSGGGGEGSEGCGLLGLEAALLALLSVNRMTKSKR
jgi:aryl-phospho-beta-D-glucosidase BglC (GH1 family)